MQIEISPDDIETIIREADAAAQRLRRKLTQAMLAERVGVTLPTIRKLEAGDPSSSLATVIRVLQALGLAQDIDALAAQDVLGRELQDGDLKQTRRRSITTRSARTDGNSE